MIQINDLINNGEAKKALEIINNLIANGNKQLNLYYLKAKAEFSLENFSDCIKTTSEIIVNNKKDFATHNLRALSYFNLGDLKNSIEDFKRTISLNPKFDQPYNFIGATFFNTGKIKESIEYFIKCLKLNKKNILARNNLINALIACKTVDENKYVLSNNEINQLNIKFDYNQNLEKLIIKFYNDSNLIIEKNLGFIEYNVTQLYRRSSRYLNCTRHKKIFDEYNVIPKFCFSCFKIQINLKNVIDLIKLHIFFNQYNFKDNLTRKCMIELRPNITEKYKGLIYCESLSQAQSIKEDLKRVLKDSFKFNFDILVKKGCTEFGDSFPKFKKLDSKYSEIEKEWNGLEEMGDKNYPNLNVFKISNRSLKGLFLQDVLVFRNWLYFAKKIGDTTFKNITSEIYKSNFIDTKLKFK
jgi:tetratricopeptide (TPR) repeat protein